MAENKYQRRRERLELEKINPMPSNYDPEPMLTMHFGNDIDEWAQNREVDKGLVWRPPVWIARDLLEKPHPHHNRRLHAPYANRMALDLEGEYAQLIRDWERLREVCWKYEMNLRDGIPRRSPRLSGGSDPEGVVLRGQIAEKVMDKFEHFGSTRVEVSVKMIAYAMMYHYCEGRAIARNAHMPTKPHGDPYGMYKFCEVLAIPVPRAAYTFYAIGHYDGRDGYRELTYDVGVYDSDTPSECVPYMPFA